MGPAGNDSRAVPRRRAKRERSRARERAASTPRLRAFDGVRVDRVRRAARAAPCRANRRNRVGSGVLDTSGQASGVWLTPGATLASLLVDKSFAHSQTRRKVLMKRALALLVVFGALVVPIRADSVIPLSGLISTIELCEQAACHVAVFFGFFQGQLGDNPNAVGTIAITVNHDQL